MRRVSFVLLYLLLAVVVRPSSAVIRDDIWVMTSDVVDIIFTQDFLWFITARSLSACAVECMTDNNCVSFTVSVAEQNGNALSGQRECRGHSALCMNATGGLSTLGARLYHLKNACAETDLQPDLLEYPLRYIAGNQYFTTISSLADCRAHCFGSPQCRSMEYMYSTNRCLNAAVTPLDVPEAWAQSTAEEQLYYYQRKCA
ncbi:hypothetical protein BaRGS_00014237 [Batillaria attramentaria]|uniref:Apple domain-containing protein n=1 Tax=Batillaria attramentaria TaxID=370345 RepID=A0ABD0L597_9CAEN